MATISDKKNKTKNNSNLLEAASEQWLNIVMAHLTYENNKNNQLKTNKNENQ